MEREGVPCMSGLVDVELAWWDAEKGVVHGITFSVASSFAAVLDAHPDARMSFSNAETDCGIKILTPGESEGPPHGRPVSPDCVRCQAVRVARRAARVVGAGS
jgi:hypothetical protein